MQNLIYLACPLSMGLMMWLMMRKPKPSVAVTPAPPAVDVAALREEVAALQRQVAAQNDHHSAQAHSADAR